MWLESTLGASKERLAVIERQVEEHVGNGLVISPDDFRLVTRAGVVHVLADAAAAPDDPENTPAGPSERPTGAEKAEPRVLRRPPPPPRSARSAR